MILKDTNAYKKYYKANEAIRENTNRKYTNYASNILKNGKSGKGLIDTLSYKVSRRNTYTDYIYWDDPNELVDRLRLLLAETSAGNNNHINEIQSIVEELREAGIIDSVSK